MTITIPNHLGIFTRSIFVSNGLKSRKQKREITKGNVTEEAIFKTAKQRITAITISAVLPTSRGFCIESDMRILYDSLENHPISDINFAMGQQENLARIRIVLVEPQDGANVGSVCRAMKTMGIEQLVIVGNHEYDSNRVKTLALHAFDIYEKHQRYSNLSSAVADSVLIVGTSRRRGKNRKYFAITPQHLVQRISQTGDGPVSIVFGREADGLTDDELSMCHITVKIPTSDAFPSLNLAQAVQIITYTLYTELTPLTNWQPIDEQRLRQLASIIGESFDQIGFYKQNERTEVERFFRDILARATLSEKEAQRLQKMFIKMARLKIHKSSGQ